jgi:hypothetical protein
VTKEKKILGQSRDARNVKYSLFHFVFLVHLFEGSLGRVET